MDKAEKVRCTMYDVIKGKKFDVAKEYVRIWKLFNTADLVGSRATSLIYQIDGSLQFFPDSFKKRALTLEDFMIHSASILMSQVNL